MADHGYDANKDILQDLGYEYRDVNFKALLRWLAILFAFIIVSLLICGVLFNAFVPHWDRIERDVPAFVTARKLPPNPQLQVEPKRDILLYEEAEEARAKAIEKTKDAVVAGGISGVTQDKPEAPRSYPGSGQYRGTRAERTQ
jgi:hypothetical protein